MTKPNSAEIVVVLDRSGSMEPIARDMEGGFNRLIAEQRQVPGDCTVTLAQFSDAYEIVFAGKPLAEVPPLSLMARGYTALLDAIGKTIAATGERLAKLPEQERPAKVLFVIITDGAENASKEYTSHQVTRMIKHQEDQYQWQFAYLGANQDAFAVASSVGIKTSAAMNWTADAQGTSKAYAHVSGSLRSARSGGDLKMGDGSDKP